MTNQRLTAILTILVVALIASACGVTSDPTPTLMATRTADESPPATPTLTQPPFVTVGLRIGGWT